MACFAVWGATVPGLLAAGVCALLVVLSAIGANRALARS